MADFLCNLNSVHKVLQSLETWEQIVSKNSVLLTSIFLAVVTKEESISFDFASLMLFEISTPT